MARIPALCKILPGGIPSHAEAAAAMRWAGMLSQRQACASDSTAHLLRQAKWELPLWQASQQPAMKRLQQPPPAVDS
ncbi:MAG: hypothetical protein FRX49_02432 [Trebouxia sp. A1-2]|nr:MAG: hypothetical protein FRX49_02432 [Trebouxia sp. A1-2]